MATKTRLKSAKKRVTKTADKKRAAGIHLPTTAPASLGQGVSVRALRTALGVSRKIFSRIVGFSERALAGWESNKPLSEAPLQRMREIDRLQKALAGVMQPQFIGIWLNTPNAAFDGLKPLEIIERGEVDRIWRMIYQLESGMPI